MPESNDPLSSVLAEWRLTPKSNPRFRPAVWQRIQARARESWANYVRAHAVGWSVAAVVVVAAGSWTGHAAVRAKLDAERDAMVVAYLSELDPRVQARLRP